MAEVLSHDQENDGDVLGLIGGSLAVSMSDVPFPGTAGRGPRRTRRGRQLRPQSDQHATWRPAARMNIIIAGTEDSIVMVEGAAREISEEQLVGAVPSSPTRTSSGSSLSRRRSSPTTACRSAPGLRARSIPSSWRRSATGYRTELDRAIRIVKKMERETGIDALVAEAHGRAGRAVSRERDRHQDRLPRSGEGPDAAHGHRGEGPRRRPPLRRDPAHHLRGRRPPADARQRDLHPRRDPGARRSPPSGPRPTSRRSRS